MRLFVNVYWPEDTNVVHTTAKQANASAMPSREALVEIEFPGAFREAAQLLRELSAEELRSRFSVPVPVDAMPIEPPLKLTLTTDSEARKGIMLVSACQDYIPAALVKFAEHAKAGNDKHNKGQPIHHARWKSTDHEECLARHLMDMRDIRAYIRRNGATPEAVKALISEATAEFWRSGVLLQELCEQYEGAPLAPAARLEGEPL